MSIYHFSPRYRSHRPGARMLELGHLRLLPAARDLSLLLCAALWLWSAAAPAADHMEAPILQPMQVKPAAPAKPNSADSKAESPAGAKPFVKPGYTTAGGIKPAGPPDLVVSRVEIVSDEVRFRVRNQGLGEKKPGKINYDLEIRYYDLSNQQTGVKNFQGVAAITSLARLPPYQETGEDRVTGHRVHIGERMRLTLCINQDQRVAESNYANNCLTRESGQVLADLELVDGAFELYRRVVKKKDKPWYKKVGDFLWDLVTVEFDPSGIPYDTVKVTIRNNGGAPVTGFDVTVGIWKPGEAGKTYKTVYKEMLAPGQRRTATVYVPTEGYWEDKGCCQVTGMVDADQRIKESDEGNNKKALAMRRIRDHRAP